MDSTGIEQPHYAGEGQHDGSVRSHDSGSAPPGLNGPDVSHASHDQSGGDAVVTYDAAPQQRNESDAQIISHTDEPSALLAVVSKPEGAFAEASTQPEAGALESLDSRVDSNEVSKHAPLQSSDTLDTLPDTNEPSEQVRMASPTPPAESHQQMDSDIHLEATQLVDQEPTHASSPSSAVIAEPTSTVNDDNASAPVQSGDKVPSANRLSISYAGASRRMVIDAAVVSKLKVFRREARIEVHLNIAKDTPGHFKGILVSVLPFCIIAAMNDD